MVSYIVTEVECLITNKKIIIDEDFGEILEPILEGIQRIQHVKIINYIENIVAVTSKSQDSFISWEIQDLEGARNERNSSPRFLFLSRRSRLLRRVPQVERTCVRPQIAGQRPT